MTTADLADQHEVSPDFVNLVLEQYSSECLLKQGCQDCKLSSVCRKQCA
ncbi:MAG: hypothetical protein LBQ41_00525 [Candidatus Ancillula sp.]|nr:hypothetical protein [Candidatus Ancillula sp.]